jgi:hypothetical protein
MTTSWDAVIGGVRAARRDTVCYGFLFEIGEFCGIRRFV